MESTAPNPASSRRRKSAIALNRAAFAFSKSWFWITLVLTMLWVGLPWLAPVFMHIGWEKPARAIYLLYSFQCHQLPQRSFFLFGQKMMYPLEQILEAYRGKLDPLSLRQFIGNDAMGYKVAWSDRMVSAYTSIPLAALIWWPLRRRLRPLPTWGVVLLALPMAIDGGTHFVSDLAGIGNGFRFTNAWLAAITNNSLPTAFYVGNALGSLNSWLRLITGVLFGTGLAFFGFPYAAEAFEDSAQAIEDKFAKARVAL